MKAKLKIAAALTSAALLGGCASGGGGNSASESPSMGCMLFGTPGFGNSCDPAPEQPTQPSFTNWANHQGKAIDVSGPETSVYLQKSAGSISAVSNPVFSDQAVSRVFYGSGGELLDFINGYLLFREPGGGFPTYDGQPGIDVRPGIDSSVSGIGNVGIFANPHTLGWSYQSFGAWNSNFGTGTLSATSYGAYGAATPASAVPAIGTATFTGKLGGFYVTPTGEAAMAAGDLTVNANFGTRSLSFTSSGTTTSQVRGASTPAPQLDLSGTLTYAPPRNSFSGTLKNGGGTMTGTSNGRFYGPAAQELGGVFTLRSPTTVETFIGGYGAKR